MTAHQRLEAVAREGITVVLAGLAFAASFDHTRSVVERHGQPGWVGLATAVGVELVAGWSVLEIRHRRRLSAPARWPVFSLLVGVAVSAACNLETRGPGPLGAVVSVLPVVLFLLVLGGKATRPDRPVVEAVEVVTRGPSDISGELPAPRGEAPSAPRRAPKRTKKPAPSKRAALAALAAQVPADDPRSAAQLARDLAPSVGLHPGTARRYLADWRGSDVSALNGAVEVGNGR